MKSLCYQLLLLPKRVIFRTSLSELPIWVVDFSLKLTFFASKKNIKQVKNVKRNKIMIIRLYPKGGLKGLQAHSPRQRLGCQDVHSRPVGA